MKDLAKFLASKGLQSGGVLASVLLYELLVSKSVSPALVPGYLIVEGEQAWHVWVSLNGALYDVAREVLLANRGNSAAALSAALKVEEVTYALQEVPGLTRADKKTDEAASVADTIAAAWGACERTRCAYIC
jgi:hypothetical protein